jgi:hypothetical protein
MPVVKCQSIALKVRLTDTPAVNLVAAIRAVGGELVQVRLALDAVEQEEAAGSAFEFRLLATNGVEIVEETSRVAYLVSSPLYVYSLFCKLEWLTGLLVGICACSISVDKRDSQPSAPELRHRRCSCISATRDHPYWSYCKE